MVRAVERQERRTRLTVICLVSGATPSLLTWARRAPGVYGRLINPRSGDSPIPGLPWACDNSAFSGFEPDRFITMLGRRQPLGDRRRLRNVRKRVQLRREDSHPGRAVPAPLRRLAT